MNSKYTDFIAQYYDVYPEGYCQQLITEFERLVVGGAGFNRKQSDNALKHAKNDLAVNFNCVSHSETAFNNRSISSIFFEGLQKCYNEYSAEFSILKENKINATCMKMQRTDPGGGYHLWHTEQNNGDQSNRALVYMLYLNTLPVESAGETEFLYQKLRIPPQENTMILWPAAYTHAHRGNTVFGVESKYIVTGWFYFE